MAEGALLLPETTSGRSRNAPLSGAFVALGLVLLCVLRANQPPEPRGTDVPATEFSAARALATLREIAGPERPHPIGSAENAAVRQRILTVLGRLGIPAHLETAFACHPYGSCGQVTNIVAEIPGQQEAGLVMLSAHYDSVAAGPGIGDDLAGVAAGLETARALRAAPPLRHPILLLFDDGEEAGLLGAEAFLHGSPEAKSVVADVNLEARGTGGPSYLFETSGAETWAIPRLAAEARHPITSSLFALVYRQLPNDSDMTVFKTREITGLNFAFIGEPQHYHTPLDSLASLSLGSLQHHGDNALAAVRGLATADAPPPVPGETEVFFDVLGLRVLHWEQSSLLSWVEKILAVLVVLWVLVVLAGRTQLARGPFALGLLAPVVALLGASVIGFALRFGLFAASFPTPWIAHANPAQIAAWMCGIAVACSVISLFARASRLRAFWAGIWSFWAIAGLALSGTIAPQAAYLLLVPALVAALVAPWVLSGGDDRPHALLELLPTLVAAVLWFPVVLSLYTGVGGLAIALVPALVALLMVTLACLVGRAAPALRGYLIVAVVASGVVATVLTVIDSPVSKTSPRPLALQFLDDDTAGAAHWLSASLTLPRGLRSALPGWSAKTEPIFPWSNRSWIGFRAPASRLGAPAPELELISSTLRGSFREVRLRARSLRGAPVVAVFAPPQAQVESASVNGVPVPQPVGKQHGLVSDNWFYVGDLTTPAAGCEVVMILRSTQSFDWYVVDRSPGLPPGGERLVAARSHADGTTIHDGDRTLVCKRVRI
jgi:hypothetical protein